MTFKKIISNADTWSNFEARSANPNFLFRILKLRKQSRFFWVFRSRWKNHVFQELRSQRCRSRKKWNYLLILLDYFSALQSSTFHAYENNRISEYIDAPWSLKRTYKCAAPLYDNRSPHSWSLVILSSDNFTISIFSIAVIILLWVCAFCRSLQLGASEYNLKEVQVYRYSALHPLL